MKVSELIEKLKGYDNFDIEFLIDDSSEDEVFKFRKFDVDLCDIAHSDKLIVLGGTEK